MPLQFSSDVDVLFSQLRVCRARAEEFRALNRLVQPQELQLLVEAIKEAESLAEESLE